jgi:D-alanyl-D-alanine carboxypeptidase
MIYSIFINLILSFIFANFDVLSPIVFYSPKILCQKNCHQIAYLPKISEVPIFVRKPGISDPELSVKRAAVLVAEPNIFLWGQDAETPQAIASISKLMTALVFLDHNPGWEETYRVTAKDSIGGGKNNLFLGDSVKIKDLFYTSLVASDNGATLALVHSTGLDDQQFVKMMNEKAKAIGMFSASFVEPTGLSDLNQASARDVARLARSALLAPELKKAVTTRSYQFKTLENRDKKLINTDELLSDEVPEISILGGKTGYTESAGYCFVGQFKNEDGKEIISVVLGAPSKESRFSETKKLVTWIFNSYVINR